MVANTNFHLRLTPSSQLFLCISRNKVQWFPYFLNRNQRVWMIPIHQPASMWLWLANIIYPIRSLSCGQWNSWTLPKWVRPSDWKLFAIFWAGTSHHLLNCASVCFTWIPVSCTAWQVTNFRSEDQCETDQMRNLRISQGFFRKHPISNPFPPLKKKNIWFPPDLTFSIPKSV